MSKLDKRYLDKREKLVEIDIDCALLEEIVPQLQSILEDFSNKGYYNLRIEMESDCLYYNDYEHRFFVYGSRKETAEERKKRLEHNKKMREQRAAAKSEQAEKDRELFEELKEKYGWY